MKRKLIITVLLFTLIILLSGGFFSYYYLLRVEDKCAQIKLDEAHACYTIDLFDIIPIADLLYTVEPALKDGSTKNSLLLMPIGIAKKFLEDSHFEATSTFDSNTHLPQVFSVKSYGATGLRSTKISTYDFDRKVLNWKKLYFSKNKKPRSEVSNLNSDTYSPLSAIYHLLSIPLSDALNINIQVKKSVYFLRIDTHGEGMATGIKNDGGKIKKISVLISKHKGQEPWRRSKGVSLKLLFSPHDASITGKDFFPSKVTLPFRLLTLKRVYLNNL